METRKIQRTGGSTYIVSLPKKWILRNNLENGDPVAIEIDESSLRIWNPQAENGEKQIVLGINRNRKMFERLFTSAYIKGFDSVVIKNISMIDLETKDFIKNLTNRFIGIEVVNEKKDMIQINSIVGPGGISVKSALRRMITITATMLEDSIASLEKVDKNMCDDIIWRDNDVNRLNLFIIRRCHEILEGRINGEAEKREVPDILLSSRTVERIADHTKNIATNALSLDKSDRDVKKDLERAGDSVVRLYKDATNAFFKNDAEGANSTIDEARNMAEEIHSFSAHNVPIAYITESLRRCFSYVSDLGEIAVNHSINSLVEKD